MLDGLTKSQLIAKLANPDLPVRDEIIYKNAYNALMAIDQEFAAQERERLFDRTDGKPKQALTGGDEDDKPLFPQRVELVAVDRAVTPSDT